MSTLNELYKKNNKDKKDNQEKKHTPKSVENKEELNIDIKKDKKAEETGNLLKEQIEQIKKERDELKDKLLRTVAESENYKKRMEKDKVDAVLFANQKIIEDLLPSLDAVDLAISTTKDENIKKGIDMVKSSLIGILKKWGLEEIKPNNGDGFDPMCMEACLFEESSDNKKEIVIELLQSGYKMSGRVIRPAKVKIAK